MSVHPIDPPLAAMAANTIRMLAVDAIQKANSGHPGMPMGAADMAFVLWSRFLRFNPKDPNWPGRDRFLLSAGHGSMLQYALLHLFGYDLPLEELQRFRQFESKTPGHPEYGVTPGVEVTTGPLGQGFANGVGMAIAARLMQARFEREGFCPMGPRIFGIVSDGDLMEGISYEAASFAGHLGLGNLVYLYDSNAITIEGCTGLAWTENVEKRFQAAGWDTHTVLDGHDHAQIAEAVEKAIACTDKPSLVICRTHIGYGSPKYQDSSDCHGSPLGPDETIETKKALGWPESPLFHIPDEVNRLFESLAREKIAQFDAWNLSFDEWKKNHPNLSARWARWIAGDVPTMLLDDMIAALPDKDDATRNLSGAVLQAAAKGMPNLFGGSADLAPSNKSNIKGEVPIEPGNFNGRNFHFGIREHAMGAIANGMALYGCIRPYTATFLVFADYMRPSIRMAALMKLPVIYIFSHDSFWVGEDGPTHQPVEHVASLRLIPNLHVYRPASGIETAVAWDHALRRTDGPTALILTRQNLARFSLPDSVTLETFQKGAYVAADAEGPCETILIASGSEVPTCIQARKILAESGIRVRVVSMLCREVFEQRSKEYRERVIPGEAKNVFWVEAGYDPSGYCFTRGKGTVIGMTGFGISAPGGRLADHFGFTPEKIAEKVRNRLAETV